MANRAVRHLRYTGETPDMVVLVAGGTLHAVGYNWQHRWLFAWFHREAFYVYHGVGRDTFRELASAQSCGQYFNQKVRGKHPWAGPSVMEPGSLIHLRFVCAPAVEAAAWANTFGGS